MTSRRQIALRWTQYTLLIAGCCALGYSVGVLAKAQIYQQRARHEMQRIESMERKSTTVRSDAEPPSVENRKFDVGSIEIPRLHISSMISETTSHQVLEVAVGHVSGTAVPGQQGNVVLAAHRDTFFRGLGEIKPGDLIRLSVPGEQYEYRVQFTDIVKPTGTWVLNSGPGQTLTLITCYPFHYVGAAPKRFIVRADRVDAQASQAHAADFPKFEYWR
jgi:sortase A